jgi:preprotein translocase subunit YajC
MSIFETAAAFAAEQAPVAGAAAPTGPLAILTSPMTMMVIIFAIFYFLIIRPQNKKQKEHADMLKALQVGDRVITTGGIYGRVISTADTTLTLQVDEKCKLKVSRSAISGKTAEE